MRRAIALLVMLAVPCGAAGRSIGDYVAALHSIRAHLASNNLAAAQTQAATLKGAEITWPGGTFHTDDTLLDAIANAKRADRELLLRIDVTLDELHRSGVANASVDPKLLKQVAAEQEVPELVKGGEIPTKLERDVPLFERIVQSLGEMLEWIGKKLRKLLEWIVDLFPSARRGDPGATFGMRWIVITVAILIVIAIIILAFEVTRRSKRAKPEVAESEPLRSKRDEDPLSRGASEWERYAAQLAAAGRFREAIRAWYHAVLVTCYSAGVLHFRKGRTNWEYISLLAPSLAWRPELIQLTRRFEREWYGVNESTEDALEECSDRARGILDAIHRRGAA